MSKNMNKEGENKSICGHSQENTLLSIEESIALNSDDQYTELKFDANEIHS